MFKILQPLFLSLIYSSNAYAITFIFESYAAESLEAAYDVNGWPIEIYSDVPDVDFYAIGIE